MADEQDADGQDEYRPPEPQGRFAGMPYDWRKPTRARVGARLWNGQDPRLLTPRAFGWGYDLNFYWVAHPGEYMKARRG
jgi:hypothetical protein